MDGRNELRAMIRDVVRGLSYRPPGQELEAACEARSLHLPARVRSLRHQWLGKRNAGCGATHGILEACNFSCTACYLAPTAQKTPPLPFEQVKAQLDALREELGPGGNAQITAGEVTLMPALELARIVRYAREIGLDPMLMTNGQTLARDPGYLDTLREAGLQKISVHVDSTQRGRDGFERGADEQTLMSVRARFAALIRQSRTRHPHPLHAAHAVTVTPENLKDVPAIVRFTMENADAFRLISLQPTANVGRTRAETLSGASLWQKVEEGAGARLNAHTFHFGHEACNRVSLFFVVRITDELHTVQVAREGIERDARFLERMEGGETLHFGLDDAEGPEVVGRFLGLFAREPRLLLHWSAYALYRLRTERRLVARVAVALLRRERVSISPFAVVVHDFMSASELDTVEGRERLQACCFKVPVKGRMVSMCELNATSLREELNREQRRRLQIAPRT